MPDQAGIIIGWAKGRSHMLKHLPPPRLDIARIRGALFLSLIGRRRGYVRGLPSTTLPYS